MDIVVLLPDIINKSLYVESVFGGASVIFWKTHKIPKNIVVGDRVYFVDKGRVSYYRLFIGIVNDPVCEKSGKILRGTYLILEHKVWLLHKPFLMKSFRGFRYYRRPRA